MFTHPGLTSQLARDHHRQMLAEASRRQLRRRHSHQATRNASGAGKIIRRIVDGNCRSGHRGLTNQHHRAPLGPVATAEPAAGQPAGLTQQRHCPGGRWTSRGPAHVVRGSERDAQ